MSLTTEDILAIHQLYARYNHAIDFGDANGWAGTFTVDGTFSSPSGTFTGTEQLAGFAGAFAQRMKARHWTNNLMVEPAEGGAAGTCYLMLYSLGDGERSTSIVATGVYRDSLRKVDGGWRFTSRTVTADA